MSSERIQQLQQMVQSDSGNALIHYMLGMEYLKNDDPEAALPPLRKALELDADYSAAYRELGKALEKTGQPGEAAQTYRRGVEVAERRGDIQTAKEMTVFLKRLAKRSS